MTFNPHAIYINCDGAMDYDSKNTGGVGYVINFPDFIELETISESVGRFLGANVERLELEAIIQGMEEILKLNKIHNQELRKANQIIITTDRFRLHDQERTNPFRIKDWRKNGWHNHEGKPIKNSDLLDILDKTRKKISDSLYCRVSIEYQRRKKNRAADKLAKAGKNLALNKKNIAVKGAKPARRLFEGVSINYTKLHENQELIIHIYRKEPVREQWEIFAEVCKANFHGNKLKIYADDILAMRLQRQHIYRVKIKQVFRFHVLIYMSLYDYKNKTKILSSTNE